jgi:hypothetical protein
VYFSVLNRVTPKLEGAKSGKRFDTWFYLAPLADIPKMQSPDASETSQILWLSPQGTRSTRPWFQWDHLFFILSGETCALDFLLSSEALTRAAAGTFSLAPPTTYVLMELAACASLDAVVAQAPHQIFDPICPALQVLILFREPSGFF